MSFFFNFQLLFFFFVVVFLLHSFGILLFLFLHTYHTPYNVVATKSDNIQKFGTVEHTKKNISFDTPHLVLQVALFINVDRIICSQKQCGYCELWEVAFPRWYLSFSSRSLLLIITFVHGNGFIFTVEYSTMYSNSGNTYT